MNQCDIFEFDLSICVDPTNYGGETILPKTERDVEYVAILKKRSLKNECMGEGTELN
jgi:hypothetical protein